jgi:hypothetical protein
VSLRGRARVLDTGDEAEGALRLLVDKYEQYRRKLPGLPVLAVDILEWRSWDASATEYRDPELDEPGAALVERTCLVAPPRQLLMGDVDGGKGALEVLVDIRQVAQRRPLFLPCWLGGCALRRLSV